MKRMIGGTNLSLISSVKQSLSYNFNTFLLFILYTICLIPVSILENKIYHLTHIASDKRSNWNNREATPSKNIYKVSSTPIFFQFIECGKRDKLGHDMIYFLSLIILHFIIKLENEKKIVLTSNIYVH